MSSYIPIHDRAPLPTAAPPSPVPRYGSPDLDPDFPYPWATTYPASMSDHENVNGHEGDSSGVHHEEEQNVSLSYVPRQRGGEEDQEDGPSRKRARTSGSAAGEASGSFVPTRVRAEDTQEYPVGDGYHQTQPPAVPIEQAYQPPILRGSIFNVAPRNPFTAVVGDFVMNASRGLENIEIEIKIGRFMNPAQNGQPARRIALPSLSEMIIPHDYPTGPFVSNLHIDHHHALNQLLNRATESQRVLPRSDGRLHFSRSKLTDTFYDAPGGGRKVRVSRDTKTGEVVDAVMKRRIADLNVFCPGVAYDLRISVNVEQPCEVPGGAPKATRVKDRASYRHQVCQVDLTSVNSYNNPSPNEPAQKPNHSFELEIEVLDVPKLLAHGEAQSEMFDDMLQNVLDSARMLVKNI